MTDELDFESFLEFFLKKPDRMEFAFNVTRYFEERGITDHDGFGEFICREHMQRDITAKLMEWLKDSDPELFSKLAEHFPEESEEKSNVVQFRH